MDKLTISTTKKKEVIDITEEINKVLSTFAKATADRPKGEGVCGLLLTHTTAALTTADLDPGTDLDMLDAIEEIVPKFSSAGMPDGLNYRHPHNPAHAPDHIMSSIIGTNLSLPFKDGKLVLGTWQRVVLVELDGPRERTVVTLFV